MSAFWWALVSSALAGPSRSLLFHDDFTGGLDAVYDGGGAKTTPDGLLLPARSGLHRPIVASGIAALEVVIREADPTDTIWKLQLAFELEGESGAILAQVIRQDGQERLVLASTKMNNEPGEARNFPVQGGLAGTWRLELTDGCAIVTHDGQVIGQFDSGHTDENINGVLLGAVRGTVRIRDLKVYSSPRTTPSDQQLFDEANAYANAVQTAQIYHRDEEAVDAARLALAGYQGSLGEMSYRSIWAHSALGTFLGRVGAVRESRFEIELALANAREYLGEEHGLTVSAELMLANLVLGLSDADAGLPIAEKAAAGAQTLYGNDSPVLATALTTYAGGLEAAGRLDDAVDALRMALSIDQRYFGEANFHITPIMIQLGELEIKAGQGGKGEAHLQSALDVLKTSGVEGVLGYEARIERSLAQLHLKQNDGKGAVELLVQAQANASKSFGGTHPNLALIDHDLALAYFLTGDTANALSTVRKALDITQANVLQAALASSEAETLQFVNTLYDVRDLVISIALSETGSGQVDDLYRLVARSRGLQTQLDLTLSGHISAHSPDIEAVRDDIRDVANFLAGMTLYYGVMSDDPRVYAVIDSMTSQKEALHRQLLSLAWPLQKDVNPLAWLGDGLPTVEPGTAVLDISRVRVWTRSAGSSPVLGRRSEYLVFVAVAGEAGAPRTSIVNLGAAIDVDATVSKWIEALQGTSPPTADPSAIWVRDQIWKPIAGAIGDAKTLLIVPDGIFNRMPWAAVNGVEPGSYLIEDGFGFVSLLDAHQLAIPRAHQGTPTSAALLVGDLDYGTSDAGGPAQGFFWPTLPATGQEVTEISALAPPGLKVATLTSINASIEAVEEGMAKSSSVHFATHGFFLSEAAAERSDNEDWPSFVYSVLDKSARNPLVRSAIVLSNANAPAAVSGGPVMIENGLLTAEEISGLDLQNVDLVVLSACETDLGVQENGEGTYGLQRSFTLAGVKTVVATLWPVDDTVTAALMRAFYSNLWGKGMGKLAAMQAAQLAVLNSSSKDFGPRRGPGRVSSPTPIPVQGRQPPSVWAAVVLAGAWH